MRQKDSASYFVEVQDDLHTNTRFRDPNAALSDFNSSLLAVERETQLKLGLIYMGRQAPGGNNIIDGLLRFQQQRGNVELIGFINGVEGLMAEKYEVMTRETFACYNNLGGYDYIGRGSDSLRTEQ